MDESEILASVTSLEEVLNRIGYSWVTEFVELQEKELKPTTDITKLSLDSRDEREPPPLQGPAELDAHALENSNPVLRRLALLLTAIHAYCILPTQWLVDANTTLLQYEIEATNLSELKMISADGNVATRLRESVKTLALFLTEQAEDPQLITYLREIVLERRDSKDAP